MKHHRRNEESGQGGKNAKKKSYVINELLLWIMRTYFPWGVALGETIWSLPQDLPT